MKITVDKSISDLLPDFNTLAFIMDVEIKESSKELKGLLKELEIEVQKVCPTLEDVLKVPLIDEARNAYRTLGKDPSRYKVASESLLRRIVKDRGLYLINNAVDAGNALSIILKRNTAVLDYDKIVGDVIIRKGRTDDLFFGIGRGKLNVSNIPVYVDEVGPFGSSTSDSERTMITNKTKKLLVFVVCFSYTEVDKAIEITKEIYEKYVNAKNIQFMHVKGK
ncbi:MAG TPA: phenylalanine--tRNA ligase beta subunit-related protein [Bacilli bacterium]|nr:phenylalanine--tRNA ligase beta subunit-related protein [Bacilli bacterium]HOF43587.1 phenylalanine--tRNA ligase beta subunit-related protein [Bacilli bacterium]HPL58974.1 phenylalanine--tRNA ligase beta subunit-related protein [Bacilli bacterium]HQM18272.1 phenylalanine--tRNA ligase beta subunit-related protein [Bacilli bacterium]